MENNVRKSAIMVKTKPSNPEAKTHDYNDLDMRSTVKANLESKYIRVTIRDIAKMFTYSLGVKLNSQEFLENVESNMRTIENLPIESRQALKLAYLFSSRVPSEDKQDFFQELALTLFRKRVKDEKLAYVIARCDWVEFWKTYKHKSENEISLDKLMSFDDPENENGSENRENGKHLAELFISGIEYENTQSPKAKRIIEAIKSHGKNGQRILEIASKRLSGQSLTNAERKCLCVFAQRNAVYYLSN